MVSILYHALDITVVAGNCWLRGGWGFGPGAKSATFYDYNDPSRSAYLEHAVFPRLGHNSSIWPDESDVGTNHD
jgi:hypothetical protein